jgi:hypothetical protein
MAKRKQLFHPDEVRAKIQVSQLINLLHDNAYGNLKEELSPSRVKSVEILLRKAIPDLSASENKNEITHRYVARLPDKAPTAEAWQQQHETLQ